MSEYKVFISAGHGGVDSGAIHGEYVEKNLNLSIAKYCVAELNRYGIQTMLNRDSDVNMTINNTVRMCNSFKPNLAIDIQNNAGGGDGAEVYYHFKGGKGKELANNILTEIVNIGQNSRGIKTKINKYGLDYYGFIRDTVCPAVLVECAFIDNDDVAIIDTENDRKEMGIAIAKGILKTLGVNYIAQSRENSLYRVQIGAFNNKDNAFKLLQKIKDLGFPDAFITNV